MRTPDLSNGSSDTRDAIQIALAAAEPQKLDHNELYSITVPEGADQRILDMEKYFAVPRRKCDEVTLYTADSFVRYLKAQLDAEATANVDASRSNATNLYADEQTGSVVAVLNDSGADAGWLDHRALLKLRPTVQWTHWMKRHKIMGSQLEFAEHIEEGLDDIRRPDAADMLEMAQSFEAEQSVSFRQVNRLANGVRSFTYETDTTAKAQTSSGSVEVPERFLLALAPYEGMSPIEVWARLRYRIREGSLGIGYALDRPELVQQAAFVEILDEIETGISLTALRGQPPRRSRP